MSFEIFIFAGIFFASLILIGMTMTAVEFSRPLKQAVNVKTIGYK